MIASTPSDKNDAILTSRDKKWIFIIVVLLLITIRGLYYSSSLTSDCFSRESPVFNTIATEAQAGPDPSANASVTTTITTAATTAATTAIGAPLSTTPFQEFISQFDAETVVSDWEIGDYEQFLQGVQEFHYQEPLVPINALCRPPPLPPREDVVCDQGANFPGTHRSNDGTPPAKIGHAIQFGFDIDTLEIHLHELYDVVDKFFIIEFVLPHKQLMTTKTLSWDHVKTQPRFRTVRDKVVHFVLDDVDAAAMQQSKDHTGLWAAEGFQERRRWEKIVEWNAQTHFFRDTDWIGFGDTDEIASRETIHVLKECAFDVDLNNKGDSESIDIGIWFPMGRIDQAFKTDFPIKGHPYTLGDPTFWTFRAAHNSANRGQIPNRKRGKSKYYLLGGMHMTHYGFFPYYLAKKMSTTEAGGGIDTIQKLVLSLIAASQTKEGLKEMEEHYSKPNPALKSRIKKLDTIPPMLTKGIVYLPWFYDCNRKRYPRWEGNLDSRLGL